MFLRLAADKIHSNMKKALIITLVIAFLAPVFRPLAHSSLFAACGMSQEECEGNDTCPMNKGRESAHHAHAPVVEGEGHACATSGGASGEESGQADAAGNAADEASFSGEPGDSAGALVCRTFIACSPEDSGGAMAPISEMPFVVGSPEESARDIISKTLHDQIFFSNDLFRDVVPRPPSAFFQA